MMLSSIGKCALSKMLVAESLQAAPVLKDAQQYWKMLIVQDAHDA